MRKLWIATIPGSKRLFLNEEDGWVEQREHATLFDDDQKQRLAEFFGENWEWIEVTVGQPGDDLDGE